MRIAWKDMIKLEPEIESWEDLDLRCKDFCEYVFYMVSRTLHALPETFQWY